MIFRTVNMGVRCTRWSRTRATFLICSNNFKFQECFSIEQLNDSSHPIHYWTPKELAVQEQYELQMQFEGLQKQKIMTRQMGISTRSMSKILKTNLGVGAYAQANYSLRP